MNEFFPSSHLDNLSFYLYCPSLNQEAKEEINKLILNNNGVSK
jgi:hypothetical protein